MLHDVPHRTSSVASCLASDRQKGSEHYYEPRTGARLSLSFTRAYRNDAGGGALHVEGDSRREMRSYASGITAPVLQKSARIGANPKLPAPLEQLSRVSDGTKAHRKDTESVAHL
eukprot:scaffold324161_cov32-Prasinocladus_malaysianus.AAC.3